jgi:hypothetical protein
MIALVGQRVSLSAFLPSFLPSERPPCLMAQLPVFVRRFPRLTILGFSFFRNPKVLDE